MTNHMQSNIPAPEPEQSPMGDPKEQQILDYLKTYIEKCIAKHMSGSKEEPAAPAPMEKPVDEMSTTGNVAGFTVPGAFQGNSAKNLERKRRIAQQLGYTISKTGEKDLKKRADKLETVVPEYLEDVKMLSESVLKYTDGIDPVKYAKPHQRIGKAISEINKQLKEIERGILKTGKLKTEENVPADGLWKRTATQLVKLESRLLNIAREIREMKK
jgi:hypothetical protein